MSTSRSTASARQPPTAEPGEASRRRRAEDRGTALVGTLVGAAIFIILLLFAAQVIVRSYAASALTSAATRAAEVAASDPVPAQGMAAAEADARRSLGGFGAAHTRFVWREADAQQVVLEVVADSPEFLPGLPGWSRIDRTVTVRTERFR